MCLLLNFNYFFTSSFKKKCIKFDCLGETEITLTHVFYEQDVTSVNKGTQLAPLLKCL